MSFQGASVTFQNCPVQPNQAQQVLAPSKITAELWEFQLVTQMTD